MGRLGGFGPPTVFFYFALMYHTIYSDSLDEPQSANFSKNPLDKRFVLWYNTITIVGNRVLGETAMTIEQLITLSFQIRMIGYSQLTLEKKMHYILSIFVSSFLLVSFYIYSRYNDGEI